MNYSYISLGASVAAAGNGAAVKMPPGKYVLFTYGTWGGGTMKLQYSPDDGTTWFDFVTGITADNAQVISAPGVSFRYVLSGGAGWNLNMKAFPISSS